MPIVSSEPGALEASAEQLQTISAAHGGKVSDLRDTEVKVTLRFDDECDDDSLLSVAATVLDPLGFQYEFRQLPRPVIVVKNIEKLDTGAIEVLLRNANASQSFLVSHSTDLRPVKAKLFYPSASAALQAMSDLKKTKDFGSKLKFTYK